MTLLVVFIGIILISLIIGFIIDRKNGKRKIPDRIPGETCMQRKDMNKM
ncbi:hypothetical protein P8610_08990 [Fictibacillus sp. UD]